VRFFLISFLSVLYSDTLLPKETFIGHFALCTSVTYVNSYTIVIHELYIMHYSILIKVYLYISDVMEQALSVGFSTAEDYRSLWLCYIAYMRRRVDWGTDHQSTQLEELRKTFNRACDHLAQCK
jgi:hypothetical protein